MRAARPNGHHKGYDALVSQAETPFKSKFTLSAVASSPRFDGAATPEAEPSPMNITKTLKRFANAALPNSLLGRISLIRARRKYAGQSPQQIFSDIYEKSTGRP